MDRAQPDPAMRAICRCGSRGVSSLWECVRLRAELCSDDLSCNGVSLDVLRPRATWCGTMQNTEK
jgi:hypothetical protein